MDEVSVSNVLERGHAAYAKHAWREAYEWLSRADEDDLLQPEDLELLARSAYMLGRDDDYVRGLERAYHGHLDGGRSPAPHAAPGGLVITCSFAGKPPVRTVGSAAATGCSTGRVATVSSAAISC